MNKTKLKNSNADKIHLKHPKQDTQRFENEPGSVDVSSDKEVVSEASGLEVAEGNAIYNSQTDLLVSADLFDSDLSVVTERARNDLCRGPGIENVGAVGTDLDQSPDFVSEDEGVSEVPRSSKNESVE